MPNNTTVFKPNLPQPKLPGAVVKKPSGAGQVKQVFSAPAPAPSPIPTRVLPSAPASSPVVSANAVASNSAPILVPAPPSSQSSVVLSKPNAPVLPPKLPQVNVRTASLPASRPVPSKIQQPAINLPPSPLPKLPFSPPPPSPIGGVEQQPNIVSPKGGPGAPNPVAAVVKKSPLLKFLPFIIGGLAVVGLIVFVISNLLGKSSPATSGDSSTASDNSGSSSSVQTKPGKQIELLYWGLFEDPVVMKEVIADFEKENSNVTIRYVKQSHVDYRERLQTEILSGTGPDIFRFHASWVPILSSELTAMPISVMSLVEYRETFYPIASQMLQYSGQIVGIPLMYDGLALFYNKKMLQTAGASVPNTWRDLQSLAKKLTAYVDTTETVQRGGLAIGNAQNVEHFADILGLLILQNGGDPSQPNTQKVEDALVYYVDFIKNKPVYSSNLPNSTTAFAREEVAMMLAPSWRVFEVLAMNPDLDFGLAPAPKLADQNIGWASFWAEGVSSESKNQTEAWAFLKYLSSASVMQKLHSAQKQIRAFGEIYSRVDLADKLSSDSYASAYLEDAPNAQGWYLSSYTHDNGLNDAIISYYADAVNALLAGKNIKDVLVTLELAVSQSLAQYGLD